MTGKRGGCWWHCGGRLGVGEGGGEERERSCFEKVEGRVVWLFFVVRGGKRIQEAEGIERSRGKGVKKEGRSRKFLPHQQKKKGATTKKKRREERRKRRRRRRRKRRRKKKKENHTFFEK